MGQVSDRGIRADVRMGGLRCFQLSCPRPDPAGRCGMETWFRVHVDEIDMGHGLSLYSSFRIQFDLTLF